MPHQCVADVAHGPTRFGTSIGDGVRVIGPSDVDQRIQMRMIVGVAHSRRR
jgi:hypothetical protein